MDAAGDAAEAPADEKEAAEKAANEARLTADEARLTADEAQKAADEAEEAADTEKAELDASDRSKGDDEHSETSTAPPGAAPGSSRAAAMARGRALLCGIHYIINEYRNDLWANLVRARNRLLITTFIGGLLAYLVLGLALTQRIADVHLVGAWLVYFAGALAGLLQQLYVASQQEVAVEDYGLDHARLFATPLLSGMAAVIGVVLTLAAGGPLSDLLAPAGSEITTTVDLLAVFDLQERPVALLLAFLFGFAPYLVLRRLNQQADAAKAALKTSDAV